VGEAGRDGGGLAVGRDVDADRREVAVVLVHGQDGVERRAPREPHAGRERRGLVEEEVPFLRGSLPGALLGSVARVLVGGARGPASALRQRAAVRAAAELEPDGAGARRGPGRNAGGRAPYARRAAGGSAGGARAAGDRAVDVAERLNDPELISLACASRAYASIPAGNWDGAGADIDRALSLSRQFGALQATTFALIQLGRLCLLRGDWQQASRSLEECVDMALAVEKTPSGNYLGHTALPLDWAYTNARLICRPADRVP